MLSWLRRWKEWRQRNAEWNREHVAAFSAVSGKMPDGLTRFQHDCLAAIARYVPMESFQRQVMTDGRNEMLYLVAPLGTTGVLAYIYDNEAGIGDPDKPNEWYGLEEWDHPTPEHLIECFVKACASRAA